jgi:hypothetical protein
MKHHVVFFSSGAGSWAAAKRVAEHHGTDNLVLLFADTGIEDEDNHRYLYDAAENVGGKLVIVRDGRTPWDVFRDKRWIGNSRVAQCSHELKQKTCKAWLMANDPDKTATLYVGIDWTEVHRIPAIERGWSPWRVEAPLCEAPYLDKKDIIDLGIREGLKPPRLYSLGFSHANCGGFCVRGGQGHFATLLKAFPERYREHEQAEIDLMEYLQTDATILRETVNGGKRRLTLRELRERIESSEQVDMFDLGGCGCFSDEPSK